jgi:hypothetical protein
MICKMASRTRNVAAAMNDRRAVVFEIAVTDGSTVLEFLINMLPSFALRGNLLLISRRFRNWGKTSFENYNAGGENLILSDQVGYTAQICSGSISKPLVGTIPPACGVSCPQTPHQHATLNRKR